MGMNENDAAAFKEQMGVFQDFLGKATEKDKGQPSNPYEEQAALMETEAKGKALDQRRQTREDGQSVREGRERDRAKLNARWGQSGVAMSGSRQLVQDARKTADREAEEDTLFKGTQQEREILNRGRQNANMHRISNGGSANRSTLSLGSQLYKSGR
ncbi:conserved protein of unknown function [Pseudodesulfovibrio profundus]|uniref:Uncharacterized protein n=1 Tax=Pseudodesulfovibrio profundus TaxID=57320 RepID=A0A2C8F9J2_9BACT|nr:hypothetical protein [Pseudodesulfovibrio profundus]SOB59114.1 conserved protein of unknown function [Pseudodesulfovibrio profundus]